MGWTEEDRRPWLREAPPELPGHGCTSAPGGGVDVAPGRHGLGGNTIKNDEKERKEKRGKKNNKEILIK